jgi:hypothetical protein
VELLMKTFKQYVSEGRMKDLATDWDMQLGPKATDKQDKEEIKRQKAHLTHKAETSYAQSEREGGGGAARAKGDSYKAAKENIKEDGGAMGVAGIAGSGDSRLPVSQREPGVSNKRTPIIVRLARRKLPNM